MFESALLALFKTCHKCGSTATIAKKTVMGTFIRLKQNCSQCGVVDEWDSQPFIKNIPAGNILLSGSILFSGSLPTQALRMLNFLGCASISLRSFFSHQKSYLQPTIASVWKDHQSVLFHQLRAEQRGLVLGGDGRADSPGHCAKYGCYTVMELKQAVVIDLQLVQVRMSGHDHDCPFNFEYLFVYFRAMRYMVATIWRKKV